MEIGHDAGRAVINRQGDEHRAAFVTDAYLRDERLVTVMTETAFPEAYHRCWGSRMLSRPLFVDAGEIRDIADDLQRFFALLTALPERCYGGDVDRYCADLGIAADRAAILERFATAEPTRYGRADLYHDGSGFKLLEFNVASDLGGVDRAQMQRSLLTHPQFAEFAAEHSLDYVDTGQLLADAIRQASADMTNGRLPRIGLVCARGRLAGLRYLLFSFVAMMREIGLTVSVGELDGLSERGDALHLDGSPIDVVFRFFTVDDVCAVSDAANYAELAFRAHEEGRVLLWTPMNSSLYSNKGTLAMLSDPRYANQLADDDRNLIDRLLPWTRLLEGNHEFDLLDYCLENRQELLLKPLRDFGGGGVIPGWECSEHAWERAIRDGMAASQIPASGLGNRWIVQRRIIPRTEPVIDPQTREISEWTAAWGMFFTPQGYAGTDVRAAPSNRASVVNYTTNDATRISGAFSVG
ncbi:hypothetical protein [Nocardia sp. NPDC050175]|uniref:hypothetical protein n=1 Tax=Nocardia sp. NPDC050175 TaxID=3364317 RepID=UPI003794853F